MVSIVIPVYNKVENLIMVLKSLNNQNKLKFEVIISDDGSSLNIRNEIAEVVKSLKYKVKYVFQKDLGFRAGQARNNGVKYSKYEIIAFLDQDIIVPFNFVEQILKNSKKNRVLIYRTIFSSNEERECLMGKIDSEVIIYPLECIGSEKVKSFKQGIIKNKVQSIKHNFKLRKKGPGTLGLFSILKKDFYKINGFDEEFNGYGYEDVEISNRIYFNSIKSKVLNLETVHLYHQTLSKKDPERLRYNKNLLEKKENIKKSFFGIDNRKDSDELEFDELN